MYWNGDPVVSGPSACIDSTTFPLVWGRRNDDRGFFHNGLIDDVEIFNRALSAEEITKIFSAGSAGKCLAPCTLDLALSYAAGTLAVGFVMGNLVPVTGSAWLVSQWPIR